MNATTQFLWLQGILGEFGITVIYCDKQSTIWISNNPVLRKWTKHIEIHMHYIRGLMHDGVIALIYCASSEKIENIFTKVFYKKTFNNIKPILGIDDHVVKTNWRQEFLQFFPCPCLREVFPLCGFASFLVLYGQIVCKGWLSLVSRPYIYDIFLILYINSGLIGGVWIIKTHSNT